MTRSDKEAADRLQEIEDKKQEITDLKDKIKEFEEGDNKEGYDAWLDEISGDVKIGSLTYSASRVLKEIDEIAYNCGYNDYIDSELTDLNDQLEDLEAELKELEKEE